MGQNEYVSKGKNSMKYVLGVDSGSLTAKAVIMNTNREIISSSVIQLGFVSKKALQEAINAALEKAGLSFEDIVYIVATGYGRLTYASANREITEISCHARGAHYLFPDVRTVIDIGGQDSKVISVGPSGNFTNFAMNEKCAAGSGKFLQVMASALDVDLDQIGQLSLQAQTELHISNTCTVFAETEVINLVAQEHTLPDILAAIHEAIASRMKTLIGRVGIVEPVMMTGGVARNIGLVKTLEKVLGVPIIVADNPQIVGAIGAALFAVDGSLLST
jgi:predicted CoA-substrate-specific enzyme activase